ERARDDLVGAGDAEGAAEAETTLAEYYWMRGERDPAFEHLDSARKLVADLPPSFAKARAIGMASRLTMLSGDYRESVRVGAEAPHYLAPESYGVRAVLDAASGADPGEAVRQGVELARRAKDPQLLYEALSLSAFALFVAGDEDAALAHAEEIQAAVAEAKT